MVDTISFSEARARLDAADLCSRFNLPTILLDWLNADAIQAIALTLDINGEMTRNSAIPSFAWKAISLGGGYIDWETGSLEAKRLRRPIDIKIKARGIRIVKSSFDSLVPEMIDRDAVNRLVASDPPPARPALLAAAAPAGPPISEKWPPFVAELVLWVEEANDSAEGMTSGNLIKKLNDRLAAKNIDEMPRSTAEATIKAVLAALCGSA